jgi:hypothetical protein
MKGRDSILKKPLSLLLLALALPLGNCDSILDPSADGLFRYRAYDTTGTLVVQGWLTLALADSDSVSGEWHFSAVGTPQDIGPQTGDGRLIGGFNDTTLWIELQPQYRDNNLQLTGRLKGDRYTGTWMWITFAGPATQGTFEAEKQ